MKRLCARIHRSERGASFVEYGFLVSLIAVACVVALGGLGGQVTTLLGRLVY